MEEVINKKMERRNIMSSFPLLFSTEKVYLNDDSIELKKNGKIKIVLFGDLSNVAIQPLNWSWPLSILKTNDIKLSTLTGEEINLFNVTNSGVDQMISSIKSVNSEASIKIFESEFKIMIGGLFRLKDVSMRISPLVSFFILVLVIIVFFVFFFEFINIKIK